MSSIWLILSILSAIGYGFQYFLIAKFVNSPEDGGFNLNAAAVEAVQHLFGIFLLIIMLFLPLPLGLSKNSIADFLKSFKSLYIIPVCFIIAVLMYFADSIAGEAYNLSPNASYPQAITNLYMLITTLLPVIFFKDVTITYKKIIGIILAIISLFLINKTVSDSPEKDKLKNNNSGSSNPSDYINPTHPSNPISV
tara:strand:+ start:547 stop:1131 length:585 start_codon:yes stop_codon:yes gene_type:complete